MLLPLALALAAAPASGPALPQGTVVLQTSLLQDVRSTAAFSRDGSRIALARRDRHQAGVVLDARTGQVEKQLSRAACGGLLSFSVDGRFASCNSMRFDLETGERIEARPSALYDQLAVTPDGSRVLRRNRRTGEVKLFDPQKPHLRMAVALAGPPLERHSRVLLSPNGRVVARPFATKDHKGLLSLFDASSGKSRTLRGDGVSAPDVAFSLSNRLAVRWGEEVRVVSPAGLTLLRLKAETFGDKAGFASAKLSPDGGHLAVAVRTSVDCALYIYDVGGREAVDSLPLPHSTVIVAALAPGGRRVVLDSLSGATLLVDLDDETRRPLLDTVLAMGVSPSSDRVALATAEATWVFDAHGRPLQTLPRAPGFEGARFPTDNELVVVGRRTTRKYVRKGERYRLAEERDAPPRERIRSVEDLRASQKPVREGGGVRAQVLGKLVRVERQATGEVAYIELPWRATCAVPFDEGKKVGVCGPATAWLVPTSSLPFGTDDR